MVDADEVVFGDDERLPNRYIGLAQTSVGNRFPTLICIFTMRGLKIYCLFQLPQGTMLSRLKCPSGDNRAVYLIPTIVHRDSEDNEDLRFSSTE